jgi:hydroxymethylglutaryl-CoA synthase
VKGPGLQRRLQNMSEERVGIETIGLAVPDQYIDMRDLAEARAVPAAKFLEGIGLKEMAVPAGDQDTVTLAVQAAQRALQGRSTDDIGLCIVGTETAVDHSKPVASFVQGMIGLPSHCRLYEVKHACYGATAALMTAMDWIRAGSNRGRKALVIASDIARYGLRTAGEPTQGAGAVALIVSSQPDLVEFDPQVGTCSRDVMDFWRPLYSKDALVDGQYSVSCYLDALLGAYRAWLAEANGGTNPGTDALAAIAYHVPYPKMAKKAHEALRALENDAAPAESFARHVQSGLSLPSRVGNIYTGSMYLSLLSILATDSRNLDGKKLGFFSYGSGCCAEFWTGTVTPGAQARVKALDIEGALSRRKRLSVSEYEQMMITRESMDTRPAEQDGSAGLRFLGIERDRRVYSGA